MISGNIFKALIIASFVTGSIGVVDAQKRRPVPAPVKNQATRMAALLPISDGLAIVKVKRVIDEAVPKLLANNPAKLADVNNQIQEFKTRTGLDPRSFDEMVFGLRFNYPSEGVTKVSTVAIANGTFSAGAIVAAGRVAANGKYQEQQYQGKTIYIFNLDQQIKLLGVLDLKVSDLAVTPLDNNTLALGDLQSVRDTIDVKKGRAHPNAELLALAGRDPNAVIGFGGNISPQLMNNLRLSNDAIARDLTAVRQVYGSVGVGETNLDLLIAAKTVDAPSAQNLSNTVEALKQFGSLFVNRLPSAKAALARSALASMKVTNDGNVLQITTTVGQNEIGSLISGK